MKDSKFHHYSLLIHVILYYNIGYISGDFTNQNSNEFDELLVHLWTHIWRKDFYYSNSLVFFNLFSSVIMRMVDHTFFREPNVFRPVLRHAFLDEKNRLDHNWGDIFLFKECTLMRVYACP